MEIISYHLFSHVACIAVFKSY